MVREGHVLTAPHFVTKSGPGSESTRRSRRSGRTSRSQTHCRSAWGSPAKVANDADLQGAAVIAGHGFELAMTLGTGFGTGCFYDGHLLPHLEFAHTPFRKGETYNDQIGERARKEIGEERWPKRVMKALDVLRDLMFFDRCWVGGGNSKAPRPEQAPARRHHRRQHRGHPRGHQALGRLPRGALTWTDTCR